MIGQLRVPPAVMQRWKRPRDRSSLTHAWCWRVWCVRAISVVPEPITTAVLRGGWCAPALLAVLAYVRLRVGLFGHDVLDAAPHRSPRERSAYTAPAQVRCTVTTRTTPAMSAAMMRIMRRPVCSSSSLPVCEAGWVAGTLSWLAHPAFRRRQRRCGRQRVRPLPRSAGTRSTGHVEDESVPPPVRLRLRRRSRFVRAPGGASVVRGGTMP